MKYLIIIILSTLTLITQAQNRKHVEGVTFTVIPPIYSCRHCGFETTDLSELNTDTTCYSRELLNTLSDKVYKNWLKSNKKGRYYIDKDNWMSTDGFIGGNFENGNSYITGGRFNDSILLVNKWYKIKRR